MIEVTQPSEPVAFSQRPKERLRSVVGSSLLMAVMIITGMVVFVPAVVFYLGIRMGTKSAAVALFSGAVVATLSVAAGTTTPDLMRFALSSITGTVLALGVPALFAIPLLARGDSFGRMLSLLLVGSLAGLFANELLWRLVASFSPYAAHVVVARQVAATFVAGYKAGNMRADAVQFAERWGNYYSSTLLSGAMLVNSAVCYTLSLLMVGRLPAGRALAASNPDGSGTYRFRNLSLPDWMLFLFVFGGLGTLATGLLQQAAANALMVAVCLYVLQGFALLRFLLASLGVGFLGAMLAFVLAVFTGIGPLLLGLAGLFDPFFDFRHFNKRKDDSHESHSD